jgi:hypothetical protein
VQGVKELARGLELQLVIPALRLALAGWQRGVLGARMAPQRYGLETSV